MTLPQEEKPVCPSQSWTTGNPNPANRIGRLQKRKYAPDEVEYIRANFRTTSFVKIAAHLGRGHSAVMMKATSLGLKRTAKERSQIMCGWSRQPKRPTQVKSAEILES